jgi:SAM-dependent methyltransferase
MAILTPDIVLKHWLEGLPGKLYRDEERRTIMRHLHGWTGQHAIQIGGVLHPLPIQATRLYLTVGWGSNSDGTIRAMPEELPFSTDSVEVVVLPHILELHANPHAVLREAHRVLVPEGKLLVTGFSPFSPFGLVDLVRRVRPGQAERRRLLAAGRVRDWMALLGFVPVPPPVADGAGPASWRRSVAGARRMGVEMVGGYVISAVKRVMWVRPVVSQWRPRRLVVVGLAEPSSRAAQRDSGA